MLGGELMQALRWIFTVSMTALGFAVTSAIAWLAGLDTQSALAVGAVAATLIVTPLGWWISRSDPRPPVPPPAVVEPVPFPANVVDPRRTRPQIVVGELPGEAVAWQERPAVMERLRVVAGSGRTAVVCAVTGQRGIGKTQVAAAYARACVAHGWPVVVWVQAETADGVLAGLDRLAEAAGKRPADADPAEGAAAALAWLRVHGGPCLVVFDNAVDADLIRRWTASVGAVQTVVTTTDTSFDSVGVRIGVDRFTRTEAVTYLRERTGLADDDGAAQVAEQMGLLPLALSQAGAVIGKDRRYTSYRGYLETLHRLPLAELLPRVSGDPYPRGTAEAILIGVDNLAGADPHDVARRLLDHLAVLAPSGADPTLLWHLVARLDDSGREDSVDTVRALLTQRSLAIPALDGQRTVVHRLIQRVVREYCQQAEVLDAVVTGAAEAVRAAAQHVGQRWADRMLLVEYADHAHALWTQQISDASRKRLLGLRGWLLHLLIENHTYTTAITLGQPLLVDYERVFGPDHSYTLVARNNVAEAYRALGRLDEAIGLYTRNLADHERVFGRDHTHTFVARNNLALAYQEIGRLNEAIGLHIRTLADSERALGSDHRDTLSSRNNLAHAYQQLGRLDEAIGLHTRALADYERMLGSDHPDTLSSRNNLAYAYQQAGRLDEAIRLHTRNLADSERVLGPDHPYTLRSRHNLASAYVDVGRLDEAVGLFTQTLVDSERVLGPDHPDTLASRNNLASTYQVAGRLDEAIRLHTRNLADSERVLGPEHPETLASRNNLASAYRRVGRLDEAIGLSTRALVDSERVLGPDHPETLGSRYNLASAYQVAGRLDEAIELYTRALVDSERVLGPDHPETLASRDGLAKAYRDAGQLDEAAAVEEEYRQRYGQQPA